MVGAPRAGTTSLYRYLQEHPQISMGSYKEPSFFAVGAPAVALVGASTRLADDVILDRSVLTWDAYTSLFDEAAPGQVIGDASPTYLYTEHAPRAIAEHVPAARIVACLRQPVERAYSHMSIAAEGRTVTADDLRAALAEEAAHPRTVLQDKDDYLRPGLYARHLARWLDAFGPDHVHVLRYEGLAGDTAAVIAEIYAFLGVDASFVPDVSVRYHQSGGLKRISFTRITGSIMPAAQRMAQRLPEPARLRLAKLRARIRSAEVTATGLPPEIRRELTLQYYADDIAELGALTGDDYSDWLA